MPSILATHTHIRYGLMLIGIVLLGTFVSVSSVATHTMKSPDSSEVIVQVLAQDGHEYPESVATVNGRQISGKSLAQRVYALTVSPSAMDWSTKPQASDSVEKQALAQLIQEQVILSAAEDLGLAATTDEAVAFAKTQQQMFLTSDDPGAKEVYAAAAAQLGVSPEEFADQPEAVEVYRTALTRSHVYAWITNNLPEDQRNDPVAFQQALDAFIAQHTENVTILLG
ncbi:MAG: SurA N-terminal domain-containing protein [Thermomicrobiales bacterium]|nr:SurA N-terminal domain-containing protein [Thermomicrobiales bacterium]